MVQQLASSEPSPDRVLELIRDCVTRRQENLIVFWVQWLSDRAKLAQSLRRSSADLAVIPLTVREVLFDNPNAVMADLARLLEIHKTDVEGLVAGSDVPPRQIVIVLISRTRLNVPQISSPVSMPSWFPRLGGHTVYCLIEDLEASADVSLSAPEVRIEDICVALFHVEGLLLKRLGRQIIAKPHSSNALFEMLKMHGAEASSFQELLDGATMFRQSVRNPEGFRPSAKPNDSLVSLILRVYGSTAPDKLGKAARALSDALGLSDAPEFRSDLLMAVVFRPTSPITDRATIVARNIILTVYGAAQLISAAAHSDAYPRFPVNLVRSISFDIRRSLNDLEQALWR